MRQRGSIRPTTKFLWLNIQLVNHSVMEEGVGQKKNCHIDASFLERAIAKIMTKLNTTASHDSKNRLSVLLTNRTDSKPYPDSRRSGDAKSERLDPNRNTRLDSLNRKEGIVNPTLILNFFSDAQLLCSNFVITGANSRSWLGEIVWNTPCDHRCHGTVAISLSS